MLHSVCGRLIRNGPKSSINYVTKLYYSQFFKKDDKNAQQSDEDLDEPIKYSESPAMKWSAKQSIYRTNTRPDIEMQSILWSILAVIVYILYLRDKNNIDEIIDEMEYNGYENMSIEELQKELITYKEEQRPSEVLEKYLTVLKIRADMQNGNSDVQT